MTLMDVAAGDETVMPPCVHTLFERWVHRTPDATAVVSATQSVSYAELNRRANALAQTLLERGTRRDQIVGVLADRSIDMVAGLLGTLKAGAAYLPLDPGYPPDRFAFLVEDSGMTSLVVPSGFAGATPKSGCDLIEAPRPRGSDENTADPDVGVSGEDLAYVIYTSGSTGRPKGVLTAHRGLTSLMSFTVEQMRIGSRDRILQFASPSFDASIWEIFAALISGATLVLGDRDSLLPGPALHRLIEQNGVTIVLLSPSVLGILSPSGLDRVRIVVAGTEKCTAEIVQRWAPGRRFFNAYGPTESTIYSTIYEVGKDLDQAPSIGRPVPNTQVFIVDDALRPVERGQAGELCVGGIGVARGYLNRPQLTSEKFVTLDLDGAVRRIYRTGDKARFLEDGNLEYLGRLDFQVKIRGFRIELGEVESVLESHASVASAAVIAGRDRDGGPELWAYFVPADVQHDVAAIKRHLAERLPDYMVPSFFTAVDRWPLTPNRKLDRDALPAPSRGAATAGTAGHRASMSPLELRIERMCCAIHGAEAIEPDRDLLDLGFHSLLIARLINEIQQECGVCLSFTQVFGSPRIADIAELVARGEAAAPAASEAPVPGSAPVGDAPLSFPQERVWYLEQLYPECRAYHFQARFDIRGQLDVRALESSLNEIVSRHEILRTTFPAVDDAPVQRVHAFQPFRLEIVDLRQLDPAARDAELEHQLASEFQRAFDLSHLPLVRWRLFRVAHDSFVLAHHEHHFLHDGWSYAIFLEELTFLYRAFSTGSPALLDPPPLQYRDYAAWQRERLRSGAYRAQLEYWLERLKDPTAPPALPSDRARGATQTFRGAQRRTLLGRDLYARLLGSCARERVTPFVWLHTVFQTLLYRYTRHTDICVGSGFANRRFPQLQKMMGMVINTTVIRGDFSGAPTFRELLARTKQAIVEAADNQDVPFEEVVRRLNPVRQGGQPVLFNTFFDSYDNPFPDFTAEGLDIERVDGVSNASAKFDLVALVVPRSSAVRGSSLKVDSATLIWEFNTDLFGEATAEQMLECFEALLESSLEDADRCVDRIPMLTPVGRARVLEWGVSNAAPGPAEATVHGLFAEQARRRPAAEAVVCGGDRLTYGELDRQAEELARRLAGRGVRRGARVGLLLDRSPRVAVAVLGVLKSGGAYVPLEAEDPPSRLVYMLEDAGVSVVVTESALDSKLPDGPYQRLYIDQEPMDNEQVPPSRSAAADSPMDLAYVMYTSGSTGRPKGVEVTHQGVVRLVHGGGYVEFGSQQTFLQLAPMGFDASTFELWGALLHGGRCAVYPRRVPEVERLGEVLSNEDVTTLWLTASLFNVVVDEDVSVLTGVKQLVVGGEALSVRHVLKAQAALPGTALFNGYGPTEGTTFTCCYRIPEGFSDTADTVPIGRPIGGTSVYVLDEWLEPVPQGMPGELYIGGGGVARGYLGQPELTAASFIPDPFSADGDKRLYRTGDRVRFRADGNLEFLGRLDDQVKIRGFRVEPAEVETVLTKHPLVHHGVVTVSERAPGDKVLVGYCVGERLASSATWRRDLTSYLATELPTHMLPRYFVLLDRLPLTANGKVDRNRLPIPDDEADEARMPPGEEGLGAAEPGGRNRSAISAIGSGDAGLDLVALQLREIWEDILGVKQVGAEDNFFDLGGHSLLGIRLVARIKERFDTEISLLDFLRAPTILGLAREIRTLRARRQTSLSLIKGGGNGSPFFFVPGGGGGDAELAFVYGDAIRELRVDRPVYGFSRALSADVQSQPAAVEEIAAELVEQIAQIQEHGPYHLGGDCIGGVVAYEAARQLQAKGEGVAFLALMDTVFPNPARRRTLKLRKLRQRAHRELGYLRFAAARVGHHCAHMLKLRPGRWAAYVREKARMAQAHSRSTSEVRAIKRARTRHQESVLEYRAQPFVGKLTILISDEASERGIGEHWRGYATGDIDLHRVPGRHQGDIRERARKIGELLDDLMQQPSER